MILIHYVQNFIVEGAKRGVKITLEKEGLIIEFDSLANNKAGRCRPNGFSKIITINETMWKDLDSFQRRALIFHELGHCVLMRNHNNKLLPRGECASLLAGKKTDLNAHKIYIRLFGGILFRGVI